MHRPARRDAERMPDVFDIYTIIFLALAVFIFLRLRSVWGQRTGRERPPYDPYSARDAVRSPSSDKVVTLPPRPAETAPRSTEAPPPPAERWKDIAESGSPPAPAANCAVCCRAKCLTVLMPRSPNANVRARPPRPALCRSTRRPLPPP